MSRKRVDKKLHKSIIFVSLGTVITTKELGTLAETIAGQYLEQHGYKILERNYRKPWGEIDIIASRNDVVAFVEVKASAKDFGSEFNPEVRVDHKKLRKITRAASLYLEYQYKNMNTEWRVDIISVTFSKPEQKATLTHFKNVAEAQN